MNVIRWEPFREMENLFRDYAPLWGRSLRRNSDDAAEWKPLANITETDKEYLIKAELPEVKKEDVKITLEDGVITISGERKKEAEHKDANEIRIESYYGSFARSFALPDNVDVDGIRAEVKDGVLKVHVPKTAASKSKPRKIEIN